MQALSGWLRQQGALPLGCLVLAVLYTAQYLGHPALPGNNPAFPAGWWGWWDQGNYLKSAAALARRDMAADQHLYPLGYALLARPFMRLAPMHPFYFVDLASLLVTLAAFVSVALRCGLAPGWAVPVFVLAVAADPVLFQQWAIPWSTTPVAAVLWLLAAVAMAHIDGRRRPVLLGLLTVCIPMLRPTDLLFAMPALAACLAADLWHRRMTLRDCAKFGLAVAIPAALYLGLHLRIYGPHFSPYMLSSRDIGFSLHDFGWKASIILVDPRGWVGGGEGLLARCPWMILGLAGLLPAVLRLKTAAVAATMLLHGVFYLSYVDLLPTSFWRFNNVHYWIWAVPGFALLAALLVRDLLGGRQTRRLPALAGLVATVLLCCVHFKATVAKPGQSIDALDIAASKGFDEMYFGPFQLVDAAGPLANITQVRGFPMGQSVRILALKRALVEPIRLEGLGLDGKPITPLHASIGFGVPFRPWRGSDDAYGPR